jgi:hypothetical protein
MPAVLDRMTIDKPVIRNGYGIVTTPHTDNETDSTTNTKTDN